MAIADAKLDWITPAKEHGAKLHRDDDGLWCLLDQTDSVLWFAYFRDEKNAAWAYCHEHGLLGAKPKPSRAPSLRTPASGM